MSLQIIECPRDAMQGWPHLIPTEQKIRYINSLLKAGFHTIDAGSFVSPKAIPQMADTGTVLKGLQLVAKGPELLVIVANLRGAEEAVKFSKVAYIGFPFSISQTFQQRNANSTIEESLQRVDAIQALCIKHHKQLVIYLSMGFGNPYGDIYNEEILLHWANVFVALDVKIISLSDTVGLATPAMIYTALHALIPACNHTTFGVHLHSKPADFTEKLEAALQAGCQRFDGALKGIGGCPMAQDALVGNMNTELMIDYFESKGLAHSINKHALGEILQIASEIFV